MAPGSNLRNKTAFMYMCIRFCFSQKLIVDVPVLVDVQHGSVRYRESQNTNNQPIKSLKGKEHPYENNRCKDLDHKENYFYHTRLKHYGPGMF